MTQSTFTIFTGDAKTMFLKLIEGGCGNGDPLDLTSCTEIDVALPLSDGSFAHRLLSLMQVEITSPAILGKFSVPIPSATSEIMMPGELQYVDVTYTIGGLPKTVRFPQSLSVFERD